MSELGALIISITLLTHQIDNYKLTLEIPQVTQEVVIETTELQESITRLARKYKQDPQLASDIIKCEGQAYKKIGNNKNYLKGKHWSTDVGWWQINDHYHEKEALKLGLDIHNEMGNLEYGFILLREQGTKPWKASEHCWRKSSNSR